MRGGDLETQHSKNVSIYPCNRLSPVKELTFPIKDTNPIITNSSKTKRTLNNNNNILNTNLFNIDKLILSTFF